MNNKYLVLQRELYGGIQRLYRFDNGYGASVIKHRGSYGGEQGLWELAVIAWDHNGNWDFCYDTGITDDVLGHLTNEEVQEILEQIKELETLCLVA